MPESWVTTIFARLEGRYGSLFLDRWRGCDMTNVVATWAEELAGFEDQPERIAFALKSLADERFPPTLPEFIAACRRAPAKSAGPALVHQLTPEQIEANRQRIAQIASQLAKAKAA